MDNSIHSYTKYRSLNDLVVLLCCTWLTYPLHLGVSQGVPFTLIPICMQSCHGQILIEMETYSLRRKLTFRQKLDMGNIKYSPAAHGGRPLPMGWSYWQKCMYGVVQIFLLPFNTDYENNYQYQDDQTDWDSNTHNYCNISRGTLWFITSALDRCDIYNQNHDVEPDPWECSCDSVFTKGVLTWLMYWEILGK